jgi:hypothetical protein
MSKRLQHDLTYDAPMAEVAEMLADTSFREEVCDAMGVKRAMVSIDSDDNGMEVTIDQVQAAQGIPSFAGSSSATRSTSSSGSPGALRPRATSP